MITRPISSPGCHSNDWMIFRKTEPVEQACTIAAKGKESACIQAIHQSSGHPGRKHMLYFAKLVIPGASRVAVQAVVEDCKKCQSKAVFNTVREEKCDESL